MSVLMNGVKAGVIVGLIAAFLGGILQVVGSIPFLNFCVCLVTPLTMGLNWFLFPLGAGLLAVMYAKHSARSLVDCVIAGVVAGLVYAILAWLIGFIVGVVLLVIWQVIAVLLNIPGVASGNVDIVDMVIATIGGAIGALVVNLIATLIGLIIIIMAGLFWGAVGGAVGSFIFKVGDAGTKRK